MEYSLDQITDVKYTIEEGVINLEYSVPLESLYHSPGVDIQTSGEDILIQVRRCSVKSECKVDWQASTGIMQKVAIHVDRNISASHIFINDKHERTQIDGLVQ